MTNSDTVTAAVHNADSASAAPPSEAGAMTSTSGIGRPTLYAALGYLAIVVVLFHRLLLGEVLSPAANLWAEVPFRGELREDFTPHLNGVQGDVWRYFESSHEYQYRAAREGRFPLWNPHIFCGFPYHANGQSAMFSPLHWLYFFVEPRWAAGPLAALRLWIAGFATYCLARRLGIVASGAFVSGVAWMLSAFCVRWLFWNVSVVAAWLPVVLIALDRLIEQTSWSRLAWAGLALTLFQLSGHPETQFQAGALTGLYVLVRVASVPGGFPERVRPVLMCLAAHVLGLLGAAVALAPFVEQLYDSGDWVESTRAFGRWLPLESLWGAVAPDHFGRPRAGRFYQGPHISNQAGLNYNESGLYVGLIPLVLAAAALAALVIQPRRTSRGPAGNAAVAFAVWVVLCAAIVFGLPGIFVIVHRLPLFSKADNLRMILGIQFGAAMLAGVAWTQLIGGTSRVLRWSILLGSWMVVGGIAALLLGPEHYAPYTHLEGLTLLWTDPSVPSPLEHRSLRTLVSFVFALGAAIWASAVVWRRRGEAAPCPDRDSGTLVSASFGWPAGSMMLLTVVDLVWVAYGFNPTAPARVVFPAAPPGLKHVVENLHGGRLVAPDEILAPNLAMVYGFRDVRGYDFPLDRRWVKLYQRLGWQSGITLLPGYQVKDCIRPAVQSVCDKCSVRFLYKKWTDKTAGPPDQLPMCDTPRIEASDQRSWQLVYRGMGAADDVIYENPTAYPRAYFARNVIYAARAAALDAVTDVQTDFRALSFVEEPMDGLEVAGEESPGEAVIELDAAEEVRVRTRSAVKALLVLSDRYDRNWRVEIDGKPGRAFRANFLFRGVVVPAGEHEVRWRYRLASLWWGGALSCLTLIGLVSLLFVGTKPVVRHAAGS